ncbi:hypothetical protein ACS0TY_026355 [Phlomoides rotata]
MRVNARGMEVCVKQAARKMIELGTRGEIVCTTSVTATKGRMSRMDYHMSKHSGLGIVRSASLQLGVHGIRVNCVSPSVVLTPLLGVVGLTMADEVESVIGPVNSLKGMALAAAHVAEAVVFLALDEPTFATGLNLKNSSLCNGVSGVPKPHIAALRLDFHKSFGGNSPLGITSDAGASQNLPVVLYAGYCYEIESSCHGSLETEHCHQAMASMGDLQQRYI